MHPFVSALLLLGGKGLRFGACLPKQYLNLKGKMIAHFSLEILLSAEEIKEVVVVCDKEDQKHFAPFHLHPKIRFAPPGATRQLSVLEGLKVVSLEAEYICIHDGARPFLCRDLLRDVIQQAIIHGAAALAVAVKGTIKMCDQNGFVKKTLPRDDLVEMQTPQVLSTPLLWKGMKKAIDEKICATDDVSLAELCTAQVKIVPSSYKNIKITTKEDFLTAQIFCEGDDASL